jgi:TATA-box binding protein (TBP) (component of TFIID and TFIIIB)
VVKPCAAGDYYKVTPDEKMELNLRELAPILKEAGFRLGLVSGVMIAFVGKGKEYSLFSNGKLMIKGVDSTDEALEAAEEIYNLLTSKAEH